MRLVKLLVAHIGVLAADEAGVTVLVANDAVLAADEAGDAVLPAHDAGDAVLAAHDAILAFFKASQKCGLLLSIIRHYFGFDTKSPQIYLI